MTAANALLTAICQRLAGDAGLTTMIGADGVRDRFLTRPKLPCILLGDMESRDFSTTSEPGEEHFLALEIWSDAEGRRQAEQIAGMVRGLLHDAALALTGFTLVNLRHLGSRTRRDGKAKAHVVVMRFRAVTE